MLKNSLFKTLETFRISMNLGKELKILAPQKAKALISLTEIVMSQVVHAFITIIKSLKSSFSFTLSHLRDFRASEI